MKKKLTFLGIETSCDETAAAVVQENENGTANILSSIVSSQIKEHKKFGGVVPEIAARSHVETIDFMTARWAHLPYDFLDHVSRRIINEIEGISRVTYDISGKPPATIEWE